MSYAATGTRYDIHGFRRFLSSIPAADLRWIKGVCLHHTASPTLAQRPTGWTLQHMDNLKHYYGTELGWSAGPHYFTDETQIMGLSPITAPGTHAKSYNASHVGIECLGDYDTEDPLTGRGERAWATTIAAAAAILERLGLPCDDDTLKFHRDDPKTDKTCPGRKVNKVEVMLMVRVAMGADDAPTPSAPVVDTAQIIERIESIEWQCKQIRGLLP